VIQAYAIGLWGALIFYAIYWFWTEGLWGIHHKWQVWHGTHPRLSGMFEPGLRKIYF
jgi:hypothetical protein